MRYALRTKGPHPLVRYDVEVPDGCAPEELKGAALLSCVYMGIRHFDDIDFTDLQLNPSYFDKFPPDSGARRTAQFHPEGSKGFSNEALSLERKIPKLKDLDFSRAIFSGAELRNLDFDSSSFARAHFVSSNVSHCRFTTCNLQDLLLTTSNVMSTTVAESDARGLTAYRAELTGSIFREARLNGAQFVLTNAACNFICSELYGAEFTSSDISCANFDASKFGHAGKLAGSRPFFQIGPIGRHKRQVTFIMTEQGTWAQTGCFLGTLSEFVDAVRNTHRNQNSEHREEYELAIEMAKLHFKKWC